MLPSQSAGHGWQPLNRPFSEIIRFVGVGKPQLLRACPTSFASCMQKDISNYLPEGIFTL